MNRIKLVIGTPESKAADTLQLLESSTPATELMISAIPTEKTDSDYFAKLTSEWNTIVNHIKVSASPKSVTIVCPSKEIAEYYMMVYNFWHASEKSDRLMSDEWD